MQSSLCPRCGLPRDAAEAGERSCPLCGWDPKSPEGPVPVDDPVVEQQDYTPQSEPVLAAAGNGWRGGWIVIASAALLAIIVVGGWVVYTRSKHPQTDGIAAAPPGVDEQPVRDPVQAKAPSQNHSPRKKEPEIKGPEAAPAPRAVVEELWHGPRVGEVVVNGEIEQINMPNNDYVIGSLNDDTKRILRGRVKTLRVGSIGGRVMIDASGLDAAKIIVTGNVTNEGVLKLRATQGEVDFRGKVDGRGVVVIDAAMGKVSFSQTTRAGEDGSHITGNGRVTITAAFVEMHGAVEGAAQLTINAEGGRVVFPEPTDRGQVGSRIAGAAKVKMSAREVELLGKLHGGAEIDVTVSMGGKIHIKEMDEGAKLSYRKSRLQDPDPVIEAGELRGGAKVQKVD